MVGGAWPFLVGGVICLVNSDNERDSPLLNSRLDLDLRVRSSLACQRVSFGCLALREQSLRVCACCRFLSGAWPALQVRRPLCGLKEFFLEGLTVLKPSETESNNRSVMPLDALGRTRATMLDTAGVFPTPRGAGNPLKVLPLWLCMRTSGALHS